MKVKVVSQAIGQRSEELIHFLRPFFVREEARQSALLYIPNQLEDAELIS